MFRAGCTSDTEPPPRSEGPLKLPTQLFEAIDGPRVFAVPPGRDFAVEFVAGLRRRLAGQPPEFMANVLVFLNTRRVRQGIRNEFADGSAGFLPRLRLVTDLATDPGFPDIPPPVSPLRRRFELSQAVGKLLEGDRRFGSRTAIYDLADSLADLLDEMHAEGVSPDRIRELDVSEHSEHWARSLEFIDIVERHWGLNAQPDMQARQRLVVERLVESWRSYPPEHPVIIAGSTGSRGATQLLMQAAARLPQGAVIVPCFDFEMPSRAWASMEDSTTGEDHPQYRLKCLMDNLGIRADSVAAWNRAAGPAEARNRLVSLALRPAPVTDQWMTEGPALGRIREATEGLTLLEAPDPRLESVAIALRLREAVENGERAALVTPDRELARRVAASLKRWSITPFDSSGEVLLHTAPGRFLHAVTDMLGSRPDPVSLLSLLKNPMTHAGRGRKFHLRMTGILEGGLRNRDVGTGLPAVLDALHEKFRSMPEESRWFDWLKEALNGIPDVSAASLSGFAQMHEDLAGHLGRGSRLEEGGISPRTVAGREVLATFGDLKAESDAAGPLDCADYSHLFRSIAARKQVWQEFSAHPLVSVWDTLDARMQSPDLVIAGGLNNGTWPAQPTPDPWLNRDMRREAGLLLPERKTGLHAHDFQQAIAARQVVLSRCTRSADAPTVPSRWLSRLTGLLSGLGTEGTESLAAMRARGDELLRRVRLMEMPKKQLEPEGRPAPRPPAEARPRRLSVTAIRTLITNPYEIYAKHVLGLWEQGQLGDGNDSQGRGTVVHRILQLFVAETRDDLNGCTADRLMEIAERELNSVDLPVRARRFWQAQLRGISDEYVRQEHERRNRALPWLLEERGQHELADIGFTLTARADRIDRKGNAFILYDYKTGIIPSRSQIDRYDKQIPLTAIMIERGGFGGKAGTVAQSAYIGVGKDAEEKLVKRIGKEGIDTFAEDWANLKRMLANYLDESTPFIARRSPAARDFGQAYHHLARFGEWDDTSRLKGESDQ